MTVTIITHQGFGKKEYDVDTSTCCNCGNIKLEQQLSLLIYKYK